METKLRHKWVSALRSGKHKQGRFELYDERTEKYCGLGVLGLCMGLGKEALRGKGLLDVLCRSIAIDCPLSIKEIDTCMRMNDTEKKTFDQIADYVEETL